MGSTTARVVVDGVDVPEVVSWEYTSDVLQIAETAMFSVVNKDRKYIDKLRLGAEVEFITENPGVRGGAPTVRHRGNIIQRRPRASSGGFVVDVVSCDKGWHLTQNAAPLWFRLQGRTLNDLVDPSVSVVGRDGKPYYWLDPGWKFGPPLYDDAALARRRLKLGLAVVKQQLQRAFEPLQIVQVEAGQTYAELITSFTKRFNYLINVSPAGNICIFRPHDRGEAAYQLRLRDGDRLNNVISSEVSEDASSVYTEVTVVGDPIIPDTFVDPNDVNAQKRRGFFRDPEALPFLHRNVTADSDMYSSGLASKQARWIHDKGLFDAWQYVATVPEHYQNGLWWDADALVSVSDDEMGVDGLLYCQRVKCKGDKRAGDTTEILLRRPGLLSAGVEIPTPSLFRADAAK